MTAVLAVSVGFVRADDWAWGEACSDGNKVLSLSTTNKFGAAVLSDADLDGTAVDEIVMTAAQPGATELTVGGIVLSDRTVRFTSEVPLRSDGTNSVFRLTDGDWTFDGIEFLGVGETDKSPYDGGAIDCLGGILKLANCTFTNFVTRFTGGAVSARYMGSAEDDSGTALMASNCTFASCGSHPFNGYGGALYVSAAPEAFADGNAVQATVVDCHFTFCSAENGGAICTFPISGDFDPVAVERPVTLNVLTGTRLTGNEAVYSGGAIFAEGPLCLSGPGTVLESNKALFSGGAIEVSEIEGDERPVPVTITVSNDVLFADNRVETDVTWAGGGAISVRPAGCSLEVCRAVFSNNLAKTECAGRSAFGGAIFTDSGVTNLFRKTAFVGNATETAESASSFGGAVSVCGGETVVDNCVFDCRGTTAANCYGSAVDFDTVQGVVSNTTVRYGATEAISSVDANLEIVNCVTVGNALELGEGAGDLLFEGTSEVSMSYTAYGACTTTETVSVTESRNLPNRSAEDVYAGDTLRLDRTEFNPVVELGLVQPEATDFDDIVYQSSIIDSRTSMGAFVEETDRVIVLDVFGVKDYDSTTRSNGCVWTWRLADTNGADFVCDDLVPTNLTPAEASAFLAERFAITNWVFGTDANGGAVGLYDSTNGTGSAWCLDGGVEAVTDMARWIGTLLKLRSHGEIKDTWFILPVDFGGGETNGVYFTWGWIKEELGRFPTNDFEESCGILRTPEENGYPRWQNYVMGVDGTNPSNRIVTTYAPSSDSAKRASCVDVVTPIASFAPPEKVGVAAEYRLYNVTHTRRGILPDTSAETWFCYATNDVPRFDDFDLTKINYGLEDLNRDYGQCLLEIYAIFKKGEKPEGAE